MALVAFGKAFDGVNDTFLGGFDGNFRLCLACRYGIVGPATRLCNTCTAAAA